MAKLKPRARIIRTVGDQLISGPEAALIELVKNSFDADSPFVKIKIAPIGQRHPTGAIFVGDCGHGMTLDVIQNKWFEPATDEKLSRQFSPRGRRMLGAKGIGRFAASRLGSHLALKSISLNETGQFEETTLEIDWNAFTADKYLDEIDIPINHRHPNNTTCTATGVSLEITNLRDKWTKKKLESLIRELRRVASPNEAGTHFSIFLDLAEFNEATCGFDGNELLAEANFDLSPTELTEDDYTCIRPFKLADISDYTLTGHFNRSGAFSGEFVIARGDNTPMPIEMPAPSLLADEEECGPFEVKINIYDRETESVAALFERMGIDFDKIGIRAARRILSDYAGISIFRNSFRIRPYGEPENDWLELERQRVQNPSKKLGISQVSGQILIEGHASSRLVERSSREGLEHNGAFERLKRLVSDVLVQAEDRRLEFRQKAGLSRRPSADVSQAKDLATLKAVTNAASKLPPNLREAIQNAIQKDSAALNASLDEISEYQKLLQSRAALGLVVAQVIHEGRRILNPMASAGKLLLEQLPNLTAQTKIGDLSRRKLPTHIGVMNDGTRNLSRLFKRLDPVSGRRRGRPAAFSVHETVTSALGLFEDAIAEKRVTVLVDVPNDLRAYGYVEDMQAAVLNILENAIYWLSSADHPHRKIDIFGLSDGKVLKLAVANNGPVIDAAYVPRLFQAGSSLRADGTGLGLAIAREACRASKGELTYDESKSDTTFVIEFPIG